MSLEHNCFRNDLKQFVRITQVVGSLEQQSSIRMILLKYSQLITIFLIPEVTVGLQIPVEIFSRGAISVKSWD
jgi:hypothetical protein